MLLTDFKSKKVLICGYGFPAEFGILTLFSLGIHPNQIKLLTHPKDERNQGLLSLAQLRNIEYLDCSPTSVLAQQWVANFAPDLILSLHYRKLIPNEILRCAKIASINLHPSLLPKYRGVNAIPWAIINGDTVAGFTYHYMDSHFDTGKILYQESLQITHTETAFSLFHRLTILAMFKLETVLKLAINHESGQDQFGEPSYNDRKLPYNGEINPDWSLSEIDRFIRAMFFPPFEPAILSINNQRYTIESMDQYHFLMNKLTLNDEIIKPESKPNENTALL